MITWKYNYLPDKLEKPPRVNGFTLSFAPRSFYSLVLTVFSVLLFLHPLRSFAFTQRLEFEEHEDREKGMWVCDPRLGAPYCLRSLCSYVVKHTRSNDISCIFSG